MDDKEVYIVSKFTIGVVLGLIFIGIPVLYVLSLIIQ